MLRRRNRHSWYSRCAEQCNEFISGALENNNTHTLFKYRHQPADADRGDSKDFCNAPTFPDTKGDSYSKLRQKENELILTEHLISLETSLDWWWSNRWSNRWVIDWISARGYHCGSIKKSVTEKTINHQNITSNPSITSNPCIKISITDWLNPRELLVDNANTAFSSNHVTQWKP